MRFTEILEVLSNITYQDFDLVAEPVGDGNHVVYVRHMETDHVSGERKVFKGRRWFVHSDMDKSDLVRTCFAAVLAWQEHEIREEFTYKGADIFNPHFDVDVLADEWS